MSDRLPGTVLSLAQELSVPNSSHLDDQHSHQLCTTTKLVNLSKTTEVSPMITRLAKFFPF